MAGIKDHKSHKMGLHEEVLTGRTQQMFFDPEEEEKQRMSQDNDAERARATGERESDDSKDK